MIAVRMMNLLDQREKDLCCVAESVLLAAVKHVSGTAQGCHLVHQALLATFLQDDLQHVGDGRLARAGLLQLRAESKRRRVEAKKQ